MLAETIDPACIDAFEGVDRLLDELGHDVIADQPTVDAGPLREAMSLMVAADTATTIASSSRAAGQPPNEALFEHAIWIIGERMSAKDLVEALNLVKSVGRSVAPFFDTYDVFVQATLALPPWHQGAMDPTSRDERAMSLVKRIPGRKVARATVRAVTRGSLDAIANTPL